MICSIYVCEIFDSCGNFMLEVEVILEDGLFGCVVVFFGVLIGIKEVVELCDGDKICYLGKGVCKVVDNVNIMIVVVLKGFEVID